MYYQGDRVEYVSTRSRHGLIPQGARGSVLDCQGTQVSILWDKGAAKVKRSNIAVTSTCIRKVEG